MMHSRDVLIPLGFSFAIHSLGSSRDYPACTTHTSVYGQKLLELAHSYPHPESPFLLVPLVRHMLILIVLSHFPHHDLHSLS